MKKIINIILIVTMVLTGCSNNSSKNKEDSKLEVDNTRVKELYKEYLTTYWEDAFYEGEDEEYGIDEFALLDINNDSILDLIIKNNELNAFGLLTVLNDKLIKVPFTWSDIYQGNLDILDEKIENTKKHSFTDTNGENRTWYHKYYFTLNEAGRLFLVNNEFISIPYFCSDYKDDWEASYGYGYFFTFKQEKDAFDFRGELEIKNGKTSNKHYNLYDTRKEEYESEIENMCSEYDCITYFLDLNIYDSTCGNLCEVDSSLLKDIFLGIYDNDTDSYYVNVYNDINGNKIDVGSILYYNFDTGTKGKNISSVEEIQFHKYNTDNIVKYLQ